MQLIYLYIEGRVKPDKDKYFYLENEPYKVFKDIGFNFSNEYLISYDKVSGALSLELNPTYIPNFFDETGKLKNITGIIGKNGSGKSSILDFIKKLRPKCYGDIYYKYIAVFCYDENIKNEFDSSKSTIKKKFKIYAHPNFKISSVRKDSTIQESFSEKEIFLTNSKAYYSEPALPNYTIVYYSNILEIKPNVIKSTEFFEDVSVTSLLEQDAENQVNSSTKLFTGEEMLRRHRLMESERQIKFIFYQDPKKYLDFEIPKYVELSIEDFDERIVREKLNHGGNYNVLFNSFSAKEQATQNLSIKGKFIFSLHRSAFFNVFRYFLDSPLNFKLDINSIDKISKNCEPENVRLFIDNLIVEFKTHLEKMGASVQPEDDIFERLKKLSAFLLQTESFTENDFIGTNHHDCKLFVNISNEADGYAYLANYFSSVNLSGFILMNLCISITSPSELSSGEKSMINFFARLNYVRERTIKFKNIENKKFLFLIDEGDQLFHPEWQRKYIKNLTTYLPILFKEATSLQVILTSHSPFIASDLPPFSLIVLDKNGNLTKVKEVDDFHSTFGANIHELYSDRFYLDKFMGEFAYEKIENLIGRVKRFEYESEYDLFVLMKEIKLTGEVFIRKKLFEILKERLIETGTKPGTRKSLIEKLTLPQTERNEMLKKIENEMWEIQVNLKKYWDDKDTSK